MSRTNRVRAVEQSEARQAAVGPSELVERELAAVGSYLSWARRDLDVARGETQRALDLVESIRGRLEATAETGKTQAVREPASRFKGGAHLARDLRSDPALAGGERT